MENEATTPRIYRVPSENLGTLAQRLDRLARRARKLGCEPPTFTKLGTEQWREYVLAGTFADEGWFAAPEQPLLENWRATGRVREVYLLTVAGETPKLNGWRFIATIQHVTGNGEQGPANILRAVPGETIPAKYRDASTECDHCKTHRRRLDTFVVAHDDGRTAQVGRNCLAAFLGGVDPETYAAMAEMLMSAGELCGMAEDEGFGGKGAAWKLELEEALTLTAAVIRVEGWRSRTTAKEHGGAASADRVMDCFARGKDGEAARALFAPTDADRKLAGETMDWLATLVEVTELNDYLHNLSVIRRAGFCDARTLGLAASAVAAYLREQEREINRRKRAEVHAASQHIGTEGKRQDLTLTLEFTKDLASDFGVTHLYKFVDAAGNVAVWFASRQFEKADGTVLAVGDTINATGTVKRHEERDGVKQTILSRVTLDKAGRKQAEERRRAAQRRWEEQPPVAE